jgi:hypothetical protein
VYLLLIMFPIFSHAQSASGYIDQAAFNAGQEVGAEIRDNIEVGEQAVVETKTTWDKIKDEEGSYKFVAPLGPISSMMGDTTDLTNSDTLINYLRTWFKFLIGIGGIIGVVRLVMVGFSIITSAGSVNAVSKIKEELISIITALVLVAGSWAFLNTINPTLVNTNLIISQTSSTIATIQTKSIDEVSTEDKDVKAGVTSKGVYYVSKSEKGKIAVGPYGNHESCESDVKNIKKNNRVPTGTELSDVCYDYSGFNTTTEESTGRKILLEGNVSVNNRPCPTEKERDCTRIEGLSVETLDTIVSLSKSFLSQPDCTQGKIKEGSTCFVVVTGGTEEGHETHGRERPDTFDLRYNKTLQDFFLKNAEIIDNSFKRNVRYLYNNYWYTDEYYPLSGIRHFHNCKNRSDSPRSECQPVKDTKLDNAKICKINNQVVEQKRCNTNIIQN